MTASGEFDFAAPEDPTMSGYPQRARRRRDLPLGQMDLSASPLPLAARDRAPWRVASLLLCLAACRGKSATFEQLHVLSWALRDQRNEAELLAKWFGGATLPTLRAWDPYLDDTLKLARAQGLVEQQTSGRAALSDRGATVVNAIREARGVLEHEQQALSRLGSVTEAGMWKQLGTVSTQGTTSRKAKL
jgi:hypothetical protein